MFLFKDTLKPKHHILTHYPRIILYSGPPKYYWGFRFEAKHKESKNYACSITSRKNITLTLAKKSHKKQMISLMQKPANNIPVKSWWKLENHSINILKSKMTTFSKKKLLHFHKFISRARATRLITICARQI